MKRTKLSKVASPKKQPSKTISAKDALAEIRSTKKVASNLADSKSSIKKFRPRKTERLSFVFVDKDGKRIPKNSRRSGFVAYVDAKGKKQLIKDGKGSIRPKKLSSWNLFASRKKTAIKKFFVTTHNYDELNIKPTAWEGSRGVLWPRAVKRLTDETVKRLKNHPSKGTFRIKAAFTIEVDGKIKTYPVSVALQQKQLQNISRGGYSRFIEKKLYHFLSQNLVEHGYISYGSEQHIQSLMQNRGKPRSSWKDKWNNPWRGRNLETVAIRRIDFQLAKLAIKKN